MRLLIIGATSAMAQEAAKCFAADGAELFLVGRNAQKLQAVADDLSVRGAKRVETYVVDLNDFEQHAAMLDAAIAAFDGLDAALLAYGTLGDQRKCELSVDETMREFTTNCTSVLALLTLLANYFERQRRGIIAVITSVAGDRGRRSNYVYGAAKGAVSLFLQGLRGRLSDAGVTVLTIKPGLVDTPMTAHLKKGLLFASARTVGQGVYRAMQARKEVVYVPRYWQLIMLIVRAIPERMFKRVKF
jgi:decaprenylphospho-beta-D-erythro-pentofuranosid-2-ulose 2-reductase